MRVCLYTETALPVIGGQELAIDALARQLQALGHDAVVLTLRARRRQLVDDSERPYPVVRHRRYLSTRHLLALYRASLSAVQRKYPFDILHCHNVYPAGYVAASWAAARGIPLVITSHACDIATDSHLLKKPGVSSRVSWVLQQASALVAISDGVTERYQRLGARDCQITCIPNGADFERLQTHVARPIALPATIAPGKYLLFLGRLVQRKGVDLLIEAVHGAAGGHDTHLVIAGSGEQLGRLHGLVSDLGLSNRVHFVGDVSGDMKCFLLQNAICTVIPSRIAEGSSLVLLESFAAGRPVIGTEIAGLREAIRPGETGWLVPEESPTALAQALSAAIIDGASTEQMGRAARRAARQCDWRSIAKQHLTLYDRLLPNLARRIAA